jgi:UDP-3-O-[3-hydroxymyristoyl] glucosamine N-acyltransferase
MKLSEVASKLGCRLEGDGDAEIRGVAGIEVAASGELTFLANRRYAPQLKSTRASAVFIEERVVLNREEGAPPLAALRTGNPYLAFAKAMEFFYQSPRYETGIHPTAVIAASARIGEGVHIGPYCFVGEHVELGRGSVLHSFVSIYQGAKIGEEFFAHAHVSVRENCRIGNRVILQNGVVIGSDGFGFAKQKDGTWYKIAQSGPAIIEDDVEIQANSTVNRATIGETRIRRGAKLDAALRTSGPGGFYQCRRQLYFCRPIRELRPPFGWQRRHRHRPKRPAGRRRTRRDSLRFASHR